MYQVTELVKAELRKTELVNVPAKLDKTDAFKNGWRSKDFAYITSKERTKFQFQIRSKRQICRNRFIRNTAKTNGAVNVEVMLDANGKVMCAKAISGDKTFYEAAENSARNAKFEIPKIQFEIKQIKGIMEYNFNTKTKTATVSPNLQNAEIEIKPNKYQFVGQISGRASEKQFGGNCGRIEIRAKRSKPI